MIESGLSIWALGNSAIKPFLGRSAQEVAQNVYSAFYFSFAPKQPVLPCIVVDRLKSPDAVDGLDARTPAPGTLIEGRFQFGSMANDDPKNPKNPSGYLSAALLSQVLRRQLTGLASGNEDLPDGTLIKDLWIDDEFDAHIVEPGGTAYIFRRILHVGMLFQETT